MTDIETFTINGNEYYKVDDVDAPQIESELFEKFSKQKITNELFDKQYIDPYIKFFEQ